MAATETPSTLSDLRTCLADAIKENASVTAIQTNLDRYLNLALQDMHEERWPWAERRAVLVTHPGYSTGTVDLSLSARTTVTGTGTAWNTAITGMGINNTRAGGKLTFSGGTDVYTVASVGGDTAITLADLYIGDSALDDATYQYFEDEYALATDFDDVMDARYFSEDRTIQLIGPQEFYRQYPRNSRRAAPQHATLIELGPSGSASLRRRVLLGPAPDRTYRIPYRYQTIYLATSSAGSGQTNLSATTDQPIVPLKYRMAIVYKAAELWSFHRQRSADLAAAFKADYETVMLRARQNAGPADDRPRFAPRVRYLWQAKHPLSGRGRRSDGGAAWDALQEG